MSLSTPSPFADNLGIKVIERTCDRAVATIQLEQRHCNALGIAHGGVLFTLADHAFGAAQSCTGSVVSMEMHIRFLRPAQAGQSLTATANSRHAGKQTNFYQVDIHDEQNRLIACVTATGHHFEKRT